MVVRVWMLVCVLSIERGDGHNQAAVLDAFEADENVGEVLDAGGVAVDDQHFKAGVMVEMRMARRDHQVVVLVLHLGQLLADAGGVVIEDEGDGAHYRCVGRSGSLTDEAVADQVPECFRAIRVSALLNGAVKTLQEIGIEGDADSAEFTHARTCLKKHPELKQQNSAWAGVVPRTGPDSFQFGRSVPHIGDVACSCLYTCSRH